MTCDFQQCGVLTSVDSYEPVQPSFKLRNSKLCSVSSLIVINYSSDKHRLRSDFTYAQADLRLCWSHLSHCWKSHVVAHIYVYVYLGGRQGKLPCLAFEVFDFFDEKWRKLPDVPSKRVFANYTATDKHIVSLGGLIQPGNRGFSDACEVFDLEKGEFLSSL